MKEHNISGNNDEEGNRLRLLTSFSLSIILLVITLSLFLENPTLTTAVPVMEALIIISVEIKFRKESK